MFSEHDTKITINAYKLKSFEKKTEKCYLGHIFLTYLIGL